MSSVAAVVLNYRNWPQTLDVVDALAVQTHAVDHLLVVDSCSGGDEVARMAAAQDGRFELVALPANDGYAAGMNAGIAHLAGRAVDAVLLLTHDTVLDPRCLELLVTELEANPRAGVVAPVLGWKGTLDTAWSAGGTFARLTGTPRHPDKHASLQAVRTRTTRSVAWADGAALLVRREVLDDLGPLPEQYFLYFEEVDFQARVRRSGRQVRLVPAALAWQSPGWTPRYLAVRNQVMWLRTGRRASLPFYLATVTWTCAREVVRRAVGRTRDLTRLRVILAGVADGWTGRLRRELMIRV